MTLTEARKIAGTLGYPSKMPGTSYALLATACILGSKLRQVEGAVCQHCYALDGKAAYQFPNAEKAMARRLAAITHPRWVEAMVRLLASEHAKPRILVDLGVAGIRKGQRFRWNTTGFHRWHDSGDLQSAEHLGKICLVAKLTPRIRHWLPTQELGIVKWFLRAGGVIPNNLQRADLPPAASAASLKPLGVFFRCGCIKYLLTLN